VPSSHVVLEVSRRGSAADPPRGVFDADRGADRHLREVRGDQRILVDRQRGLLERVAEAGAERGGILHGGLHVGVGVAAELRGRRERDAQLARGSSTYGRARGGEA
jgi:hypothetical protein